MVSGLMLFENKARDSQIGTAASQMMLEGALRHRLSLPAQLLHGRLYQHIHRRRDRG